MTSHAGKKGQRKIISPHIFCGSFRRGILETAGNFCASFFLYRPSLHLLWTKLSSRRILSDSFGLVILHLFRVRLLWTSWNFPTRSFSNDWNRNSVCLKTRARTSNACCHSACQPPLRAKSVLATPLYESQVLASCLTPFRCNFRTFPVGRRSLCTCSNTPFQRLWKWFSILDHFLSSSVNSVVMQWYVMPDFCWGKECCLLQGREVFLPWWVGSTVFLLLECVIYLQR